MSSTAVRVGLRVRPLTQKEQFSNCAECLTFIPNEPQILIGTDKSFTYDYVFDSDSHQAQVYATAAAPLLHKFMEGFNATILAYGQTGSGKTYSMGTGLDNGANPENEGIVPRCIVELFRTLQEKAEANPNFKYEIFVSFLELYNEELLDLLNSPTTQRRKSGSMSIPPTEVTIREDIAGNIYWSGVKEEPCYSPEELLGFLAKGSLCRTTGSTDMNSVSSRSHAVFSVILKQQRPDDNDENSITSITSKFHFVDLAGSERLKRTNAQGDRAKEGIAINSGLLALGNVISALGDESRRTAHVPYRDSKLTRLLQDSLGGNSQTLMLACVSPADSNFMETLNTLKYANRARNIKNRVTINQDFAGSSIEVNQLRALVTRLRMEIASLRANGADNPYTSQRNDEAHALRAEVVRLRDRIQDLSTNLIQVTSERDTMVMERELGEFLENNDQPSSLASPDAANTANDENRIQMHPLIAQYQKTIQDLHNELADTKDRLTFLETTKPSSIHAMALANVSTPSHSALTFSRQRQTPRLEPSLSTSQRRRKPNRRRRVARMTHSSSSTTTGARSSRTVRRSARGAKKVRESSSIMDDPMDGLDDEYIDEAPDQENMHQDVKESIAKARAEIRKGMEMLELIKPLEDTANAWEEELKAFEEAEKTLYGGEKIERSGSDEGNFTATSSCVDPSDNDFLDDIEALAVPSWNKPVKPKRPVDEDGQSQSSSQQDKQSLPSVDSKTLSLDADAQKYNPQLVRMFHQIQSDIRVKEELVQHLEKSETEYAFMKRKFDDKISHLQSQLADLQKQKDTALSRTKSAFTNKSEIAAQMREKQQLIEIRHAYEGKMKSLLAEISELKRKYSQTTMTMQATRNQNESLLRSLRVNVETLKVEKKRMVKRMKQEAERVREQMSLQDRKIQQLQRLNAEANMARRRLEREHEAQKLTLKRRNEEVIMNNNQLKQLTNILKKAVREGGVLDERLLGKLSHVMGGSFAALAKGNLGSFSRRTSRQKNPIPVAVRAARKKQLLDRALYQYIQGKQAVVEMEQLLFRRERLAAEKLEVVEERKHIYLAEKETAESTGEPMDTTAIEFTDERIDMIEAEISYLSARIRALQSEAAGEVIADDAPEATVTTTERSEKRVTFADEIVTTDTAAPSANDEWADMDALEEQYNVPNAAAPEIAYDVTLKLLRSLEPDECRTISEALVDDIMNIRMSECNRQVTMQSLEKTVQDLRRTLIVMKRAAIATTVENERRIRKLEEKSDKTSAIDDKIEEYINNGNTIFDKIYEDGIRGVITTPEPGLDYNIDSPGSSVVSFGTTGSAGSHSNEDLNQPPTPASPLTSPGLSAMITNRSTVTGGVRAPASLTDKRLPNRDSTPSPDRFYNMIQKRMSWQQRVGGSESPIPITMVSPAEFTRYTADRESSTSSIRSSHLRRSSVQSDYSSSQNSWNQTLSSASQGSLRKRSFSLQQPPVPTRRRASLRELSLLGTNGTPMMMPNHSEYDMHHGEPPSPHATVSYQQQRLLHKRASFGPSAMASMVSMSTAMERCGTPSGGNVFDRLSQTPTRASRAKMSHRHSSSSMDDLRQRWETERTTSAMSGVYYGD
ncbi:uncharacterized protein BYT42DRAFT_123129 [Radiomyces spectabilis]|uniref:uncharacterized protein n=1 Tax=Radiomyces spectabilis TaxID=64574 RepID=UPI0022207693|nr:uncharacterized protein BYT42DRAFT_123129 [Radiomyces spectabilis]KAI8368231.1 hypothetical protein BYT42DRAFT_123129 [Radiomyces spectabilis]